jgi:hypothetical protein
LTPIANSTPPRTAGGNNQIEILRGDGTGRLLTPGKYFPTGRRPYERLRTADFNHDGHLDIVTTNLDDDTVSILLGVGRGGLRSAAGSPFPAGAKPWQVAIDDLNSDGNPDLIVIPYQRDITHPAENAVSILLGDGHGGLRPMSGSPLPLADCRGPNSVAAGDLTGDRTQSIVVACAESRTMLIYHRGAAGQFTSTIVPIAGGWGSVAIARALRPIRATQSSQLTPIPVPSRFTFQTNNHLNSSRGGRELSIETLTITICAPATAGTDFNACQIAYALFYAWRRELSSSWKLARFGNQRPHYRRSTRNTVRLN